MKVVLYNLNTLFYTRQGIRKRKKAQGQQRGFTPLTGGVGGGVRYRAPPPASRGRAYPKPALCNIARGEMWELILRFVNCSLLYLGVSYNTFQKYGGV